MTHRWLRTTAHKRIPEFPLTTITSEIICEAERPTWDDPVTTEWWNPIQAGTKHKTESHASELHSAPDWWQTTLHSESETSCVTSHPPPGSPSARFKDFTSALPLHLASGASLQCVIWFSAFIFFKLTIGFVKESAEDKSLDSLKRTSAI